MISLQEFKNIILKTNQHYQNKLQNKLANIGLSGEKLVYNFRKLTEHNESLFVDEEFAKWASNHNRKWNDSNIFCDSSVNSLSNCCRLKSSIEDLGYFEQNDKAIANTVSIVADAELKKMYEDYLAQAEQF